MYMNPEIHLFLAETSLMWYQLTSFFRVHLERYFSNYESNLKKIEFQTLCLNKKVPSELFERFKIYKKDLFQNQNTIKVTDFGAGSKIFQSNIRAINKIARVAGMTDKKAKNLINVCLYQKPKRILEIGTSLGLGTYAHHLGAPNAEIISTEGCPNTAEVAQNQLKKYNASNVNVLVGDFKYTLPEIFENTSFDLVYFDGNHSKEATLRYFELAVENAVRGAIYIFDDIHWSKEMNSAWKKIKNHSKVETSITTYEWGILIF